MRFSLLNGVISEKWRLVLLSFLMLFVELALIRWLGSVVLYLSYFSNFVLLGSFLGIGLGFLRAKARIDLFPWAGIALALLVAFIRIFPVTVERTGSQLIYFGPVVRSALPIWVILPVIFLVVALVMSSIAQGVARTFASFEPLEAYRLDILGSLAGVVTFSALSFLSAPPLAWGIVVAVTFLVLYAPALRLIQIVAALGLVVMLARETFSAGDSWSPYYKISVFPVPGGLTEINVNGVPHQTIESLVQRKALEPMYFVPYKRLRSNPLRNVLIIGAGNGGDVAVALAAGAKHVDAVEIDPRIYQIGTQIEPDHPYQDPRVTVHIDDGRAFLQKTQTHYDLILLALPDSIVLVSGQSSLRLESYLFTLQAMQTARAHLNAEGVFAMYNYYRENWLIARLAKTLQVTYGHAPCVDTFGAWRFAVLTEGLSENSVTCPTVWQPQNVSDSDVMPTDDDHPFLYLRSRSIPPMYLLTMSLILLVSLVLIRSAAGPLTQMRGYLDLFFMGAAFLLLETKNVVQFALLFGTTWFVNALVFFGILVAVLAAIEVARRVQLPRTGWLYVLLFATLALGWAVDPQALLALSTPLRFVAAVGVAFAPIFLANLVFADRFRDVGSSTTAFGANLLGSMVGGLLEYSSLILGYRDLLLVVALLYGLAFFFGRVHLGARVPENVQLTTSPLGGA
ncbi:MAG TPA: hypothetical protein VME66_09085 [Candidatus Acidoferrales bacterium]|nr:hypothetical protein [Candidatus Acidoferrales bacterium]